MTPLFDGNAGPLLREHFLAAGAVCRVESNSDLILAAARQTFVPLADPPAAAELSIRLSVDPAACSRPPWPQPRFRGLDHLVVATFDAENTVLADLRQKRALGRISPAMAASSDYLRRLVFPALFGIFTFAIAVTPLHTACVEGGGRGLLLTGASGSGKSTLSLALAREGFGFLSDEWTYFSWRQGRLLAWGLQTPVKLLPDAPVEFRELEGLEPSISLNGEAAYEIDPEGMFGIRRSVSAEPHWLIILDRQSTPGFTLTRASRSEVAAEFEDQIGYFAEHRFLEGRDLAAKTVRSLGEISCWRLQYGGRPATVARALAQFLGNPDDSPNPREPTQAIPRRLTIPDPLRQSIPTPLTADVRIMGHAVRLETNGVALLEFICDALQRDEGRQGDSPAFLWRLVIEPDGELEPGWREMAGFSDSRLSLVNFGQRSFIAIDRDGRQAVGFFEEGFAREKSGFVHLLLETLITLTAPALGLAGASAAPAARESRNADLCGSV